MYVYLTRGDACLLPVYCKNTEGEFYIFKKGETLRLRVFKKRRCDKVVLMKDVKVTSDTDRVDIFLTPEDTRFAELINSPVEYWYEIELNHGTTSAQTVVGYDRNGPKVLRLYPEGYDQEDESATGRSSVGVTESIFGCIIDPDVIRGKSAYEIAVDNGFEGSEVEWLEYMQSQTRANAEEVIRQANKAYDMIVDAREDAIDTMESMARDAYDIVQTSGYGSTKVMSQVAVTELIGGASNAVKGFKRGTVVRFDDISPLEHLVDVKIYDNVDIESARVYSCGKNLLSKNKVTVPFIEATLFSGYAEGSFCLSYKSKLSGNISANADIIRCKVNGEEIWIKYSSTGPVKFSGYLTEIKVYNPVGATGGSINDIQLEVGTEATAFEPYVEGQNLGISKTSGCKIKSIYPNMTIYSDTQGTIIDVNYNKDTSKIIEKLTNAIISMGGTV